MADDQYWPEVVVAAVDLLGVRGLVSRGDHCASAATVLGKFLLNASENRMFGDASFASVKTGHIRSIATSETPSISSLTRR
jgi:hypothetical protein